MNEILGELIIKYPFYANLITKLIIKKASNIQLVIDIHPYYTLRYNPSWFETLDKNEKIGVILHELLHLILLHPFRRGERDKGLWSLSCDISVNQYIEEMYYLKDWIRFADIIKIYPNLKPFETSEYYYNKLGTIVNNLNLEVTGKEGLIQIDGVLQLKFDILVDKKINSNLGGLGEIIGESVEILGENKQDKELGKVTRNNYVNNTLDWKKILKEFLTTLGKAERRKSYKRVSRRFDYLPGNVNKNKLRALVALDESASMSDELINVYLMELKKINRITGIDLWVTRFDSECSSPIPLRDYIEEKGRKRRGGTDFRPVFDLATSYRFPSIIIFTDGDGRAPEEVSQRVLWLLTSGGKKPSNYGEEVYFTV